MSIEKLIEEIKPLRQKLETHPIYQEVKDLKDLRTFMSFHVYSVWDFMSLVKFIQHSFAPSGTPWLPPKHPKIAHFINDIVLEEESDALPSGEHLSHFEMYIRAMQEVGAPTELVTKFISAVQTTSLTDALSSSGLNTSIKTGIETSFGFLNETKPHIAASAFCFGRENIIPDMFRELIAKMNISTSEAPLFHFYLNRHVELDGDVHGPMALDMIQVLCEDNDQRWSEATNSAKTAIQARINLWDFILKQIKETL